ncbi:MAG: RIO1 family regulatory kinase/ATPase [Fervidicoccaceae archaeon]
MRLGEVYKMVPKEGFKILSIIDSYLYRYEYVPQGVLSSKMKLPPGKMEDLLEKLISLSLIKRKIGREVGYRLTYFGLSLLSLKALADRGVVEAIGEKIGVGKESEIYEALSPTGTRLSLKFHMVGKESFKKLVKVRAHAYKRTIANWLIESKNNAAREYKALLVLSQYTDNVPNPLGYNRNAVVTEFIEGIELYKISTLSDSIATMEKIIETVAIAYKCAGIVHGDLSEYNVLIRMPDEEPILIDWPQYVTRDNQKSSDLLKRDICYISRYFNKRFKNESNCEELYKRIITDSYNIICEDLPKKGNGRHVTF